MKRKLAIATGALAFAITGSQVWRAFELRRIASFYSDSLGFLIRGDAVGSHYTSAFRNFYWWLNVEAALSTAAALVLIFGAALVFTGKSMGLRLVAVGCGVVVIHASVGWVVATRMIHWFVYIGAYDQGLLWFNPPSRLAIVLLSFAAPGITLVLEFLSGLSRWRGQTAATTSQRSVPQVAAGNDTQAS
ncbi:MAG: hypothetical protein K2X56_24140 [Mycobacterium pseudokansasii]|uniref:Uncharacterized protein n=1 Tax=Mycobacterium pseudokansasii TaxID=2341080 RepID=A0A498R097_9MYCO|nr:hypothetical protein [Mycobacterium pseudokansasii]KZS60710.1 hypothetical protein A4G27_13660 [Mycobacterium kansasii]MBY0391099.1 hypothetical protein [Mycobacterium pseudokansasii]VAZ87113.1 hypothetical protein LAUMK35_00111 [Mycobacterium pseudokansasii]VAZ87583.1 hypothetical protein LAUMK21_00109 [Mycobacterium pseudokansasii]VBA56915.1 hypothetical protein LAUMK142_05731 [Mycobacterium pseudokansasii]